MRGPRVRPGGATSPTGFVDSSADALMPLAGVESDAMFSPFPWTEAGGRFLPGRRRGRTISPRTAWQNMAMAVLLVGRQCFVSNSAMARYDARFCRSSAMRSFAGYRSWNFCGRLGVNSATALRTAVGSNEDIGCNHADMNVERAGDEVETRMRRRGQFLASRCSRRGLVHDQFADVDSSRLRTVCTQFVSAGNACSRNGEAAMCSRMRPICDRDCGRGLSAHRDCSRTRIMCVSILIEDCSSSRICRASGHER